MRSGPDRPDTGGVRARPAPTVPQEVRWILGGRRATGVVRAQEPWGKIGRLETDDERGGHGGALEDARGRVRYRATQRDDEIDDVIEIAIVVDAGTPRLIGRARVGERHQGEEGPAEQRYESKPATHA
jgi:hypothetical protein